MNSVSFYRKSVILGPFGISRQDVCRQDFKELYDSSPKNVALRDGMKQRGLANTASSGTSPVTSFIAFFPSL